MRTVPFDSTLAFLREGYPFIASRCEAAGTDVLTTRLALHPVTLLRGAEAARVFYDGRHLTRQGAMPALVQHLLQDEGSVQSLDGAAHHRRKRMFLSLMGPEAMDRLGALFEAEWDRALARLHGSGRVRLDHLSRVVLTRAALRWCGIGLEAVDVPQLTTELSLMIDQVARPGPANWYARWRRRGTERWASELVEQVRAGDLTPPPESPLAVLAAHTEDGDLLPPQVAAVEILNLLRPLLAVSRFLEFAAVALVRHPQWRDTFAAGDERDLEPFVQEVRRFFPFFPAVPGRVRAPFRIQDHDIRIGDRVILDLYGTCHDRRTFPDPDSFRPERFRGWSWQEDPFTLIAQGAGQHEEDHRCPGEWSTVALLERAVRLLSRSGLTMPPQDLSIPLDRFPAAPRSGVVLAGL